MNKILIDEAVVRQALEALETAPLDHNSVKSRFFERRHYAITALRQALANEALDKMADNARELGFEEWWSNEGSQAPKPTDDMYEHCKRMCEIAWANGAYKALEQPTPAQPLTHEQIQTIAFEAVKDNWDWLRFARAIEAAVLAKNGTSGEATLGEKK